MRDCIKFSCDRACDALLQINHPRRKRTGYLDELLENHRFSLQQPF
jgi:hypothetical protein